MKSKKLQVIELLIITVLLIIIIFPLISIFWYTFEKEYIFNTEIYKAIKGSAITSVGTVLITVPLSLICAFCVTHTNIRFKTLFSFFCTLPLFLPPISFGFSLLSLFGKNGLFYSLFGIRLPILGELGVVMGLILYTFPVAFLMFKNSMLETDGSIYESAILLRVSIVEYFFNITIPQIQKTLINVILLVSMMSLTEYGICLVVGGKIKTLSLLIYRQAIGSLDFSAAIALCSMLIVPILFLFLFEFTIPQEKRKMIYKKFVVNENKKRDFFAYIILLCTSFLFTIIILSFVIMSFSENYPIRLSFTWKNLIQVVSKPYIHNYINSIIIAVFTSIIGCFLSFSTAYFANKDHRPLIRRLLFFISTLTYMIPGFILGIGYMIIYKGKWPYNTYIILIMVNIAHFFASPFLMAYRTFYNMSPEYADIAQLYEIKTKYMFFHVYLPYFRNTFLDTFFYYFCNSMITISAVVFLYTSHTMPYSLILKNFEGSIEYLSKSSSVSLVILLTNLCVFVLTSLLKQNEKQ